MTNYLLCECNLVSTKQTGDDDVKYLLLLLLIFSVLKSKVFHNWGLIQFGSVTNDQYGAISYMLTEHIQIKIQITSLLCVFFHLQSCSSLLPRLVYFFARLLLDRAKEKKKQCNYVYIKPPAHSRCMSASRDKNMNHTWAAWRSSALLPSAPLQTLCNAPPGRGQTACACRWHHTGPVRGRTRRPLFTCVHWQM